MYASKDELRRNPGAFDDLLKDKKATWDDTPASEKHLVATAKKVAKWFISKEIQKGKRAIVSYGRGRRKESLHLDRHLEEIVVAPMSGRNGRPAARIQRLASEDRIGPLRGLCSRQHRLPRDCRLAVDH